MQYLKSSSPSKSTTPGISRGYKSLMIDWITIYTINMLLEKETRCSLSPGTCNKSSGMSNSESERCHYNINRV